MFKSSWATCLASVVSTQCNVAPAASKTALQQSDRPRLQSSPLVCCSQPLPFRVCTAPTGNGSFTASCWMGMGSPGWEHPAPSPLALAHHTTTARLGCPIGKASPPPKRCFLLFHPALEDTRYDRDRRHFRLGPMSDARCCL